MSKCPINHSLIDLHVQESPYAYYKLMHDNEAVHYDKGIDTYLVSDYNLVRQAAEDVETFSSNMDLRRESIGPSSERSDELFKREGYLVEDVLTQVDPPKHTAYRRMVSMLFVGPVANKMENYIESHVDTLIDSFIDKGEVAFFSEFAIPLPLDLIADQLGVPREDKEKFKEWTDAIIETLGVMLTEERKLECTSKIIEFQHYFVSKMEQKKIKPSDDIISTLASARIEQESRELTTEEKLALIQQLLVAGNETSRNHLARCMLFLCQKPDLQDQLRNDPSLIRNFVEEVLRLESPVQGLFRKTTKDIDFGGTHIPKGSKVMLMYGAANRDAKRFTNPDELDVTRRDANRHLAFGAGPHGCVGSMLARKEIQVSIRQFLKRLEFFKLKDNHESIRHKPNLILRGIDGELNIVFSKAANCSSNP